jgi:hypothetical protein
VRGSFFSALGFVAFLFGLAGTSQAQTPIMTFADVAGRWTGHTAPSVYRVTLEIDPSGRFKATSPLGNETGVARLVNGTLVVPFTRNEGHLQLTLVGERLAGPGVLGSRTGNVHLVRTDRHALTEAR